MADLITMFTTYFVSPFKQWSEICNEFGILDDRAMDPIPRDEAATIIVAGLPYGLQFYDGLQKLNKWRNHDSHSNIKYVSEQKSFLSALAKKTWPEDMRCYAEVMIRDLAKTDENKQLHVIQ